MKHQINDFSDTVIAFRASGRRQLRKAVMLFRMLQKPWFVAFGKRMVTFALKARLPVAVILRPLVFRHFCGGESLELCMPTIGRLMEFGIKAIPDYSAEGKESTEAFERVKTEVLKTIEMASDEPGVSFAVFKPTGIAPFALWEKLSGEMELSERDLEEKEALLHRFDEIFTLAAQRRVPVFIDAEETWIQPAVDGLVRQYSERFNSEQPLVYNTVQMYRTDRLEFMQAELVRAKTKGYCLGYKIVRGAYHEKEVARSKLMGYECPVFLRKDETDEAYNAAITYCFEHRDRIGFCAATHNEHSSLLLAKLLAENDNGIHLHISFAQLYGMSDHITYNLAHDGFQVAKYLPYGPVSEVIPYLLRRAEENRAVEGQTNRELYYLKKEIQRRKRSKKKVAGNPVTRDE